MNTRQCLTRYGKTVHHTADISATDGGRYTFCNYTAAQWESEEPGERQAWRVLTRDRRRCHRCDLAIERLAER